MMGDNGPLMRREDARLLLQPGNYPLDGRLEVFHRNRLRVAPGRDHRRLIDQVRKIGTREARRERRQMVKVDIWIEEDLTGVKAEDLRASGLLRAIDQDLAVEAAGAQQRGVQDFGPVRSGQQHETATRVEPVKFGQQLVERLLFSSCPPIIG